MPISWFDLILIIICAGFVFNGLTKGLIRLLGRIVGLIIGAIVASYFYIQFYEWGQNFVNISEGVAKVLSFIILFTVATKIINWIFVYLEKGFKVLSIIPFTGLINRILGAVLGFLEGALFLGVIVYVIDQYSWLGGFFSNLIESSLIVPYLLLFIQILLPLLPEAIKAVESVIEND